MNDSPYRGSPQESRLAKRTSGRFLFCAGMFLVGLGTLGMAGSIFGMNNTFMKIASPNPAPIKPSEIAELFTSFRMLGIVSFLLSLCGVVSAVRAFTNHSSTVTPQDHS